MDLFCEKYNEQMPADGAFCRHPKEYCKFRTSCIIHYMASASDETKSDKINEHGTAMLELKFAKGEGLLPAIVQDYQTNEVLMLAYINEQAWQKTIETGKAHYWSRSRKKLWLKGESSKHYQLIKEILVDCDQDCLILKVRVDSGQCHVGYQSCFYRGLKAGSSDELEFVAEKVYDPSEAYKKS